MKPGSNNFSARAIDGSPPLAHHNDWQTRAIELLRASRLQIPTRKLVKVNAQMTSESALIASVSDNNRTAIYSSKAPTPDLVRLYEPSLQNVRRRNPGRWQLVRRARSRAARDSLDGQFASCLVTAETWSKTTFIAYGSGQPLLRDSSASRNEHTRCGTVINS